MSDLRDDERAAVACGSPQYAISLLGTRLKEARAEMAKATATQHAYERDEALNKAHELELENDALQADLAREREKRAVVIEYATKAEWLLRSSASMCISPSVGESMTRAADALRAAMEE